MKRVLIIPAAGRGSRLDSSIPKVLFPVNGRPMIDHLLELYAPVVDAFVVVLHPSVEAAVRRHCARRPYPVEYAVQPEPTGMLDAVLIPQEWVVRHGPEWVWITWCDQVAIHPGTVRRLAEVSTQDRGAGVVVLPTMVRGYPYVHLVRDERGEIVNVLHRREGDGLPERGESDMGLFSLSRDAYLRLLPAFAEEIRAALGTGERNFLPFVAWLQRRGRVRTFPGSAEMEAVGVNTMGELRQVEEYLRNEERRRAVGHHSRV